jgi:hypothetical protein
MLSAAHYTALNVITVNNKQERMWKEVAENLPGKTEENHKKSIRTANLLGKT